MTIKSMIGIFLCLFIIQGIHAAELKDSTLRDEDISASLISVEYFTRPDGLLEYVYNINSPTENKGKIVRALIDLSCTVSFESVALPYADGKPGYLGGVTLSEPAHTPTAIHADSGSAASYGITENNEALWGLYILPGNSISGLRLVSSAAPGIRSYQLVPWVDYDETWSFPEDDSLVPDTEDFIITGTIVGPGCPGVTEPPATATYPGTGFRVEPDNINALLSYRIPQKDRFHVAAGVKETTLHIVYSSDIDANTFKVQPAWMKRFFNPVAGTDEKVIIPLKKARNKIKLSVHTVKVKGTTRKNDPGHHSFKDTDVFEVRVNGNKK